MSKLEDAKKTRKAARGWLSRAVKALDTQVKHNPIVKDDLEDALSTFDDRLAAVDSAQNGVELLLPKDELDADLDVAGPIKATAWAVRRNAAREIAIIKASGSTDNKQYENGATAQIRTAHILRHNHWMAILLGQILGIARNQQIHLSPIPSGGWCKAAIEELVSNISEL